MKRININEKSYKNLKEKLMNEISYKKVEDASYKSENVFYRLTVAFDDFYEELRYNTDDSNPYIRKIKQYANAISDILQQKNTQRNSFDTELSKVDHEKFYNSEIKPGEEEELDYNDLGYLQKNYPKSTSNQRFDGRHMTQR